MSTTLVQGNSALDAGGVQVDAASTVSVVRAVLRLNVARYSGGAMRFVGIPGTANASNGVHWRYMAVLDNRAVSGGGAYWSLPLPYDSAASPLPRSACTGCSWRNTGGDVSTTAVRAALLPVGAPVGTVAVASGMRVADYQPDAPLRPRVGLLDALNQPAGLDNDTVCVVSMMQSTDPTASVTPLAVQASRGVVASDTLVFRGNADAQITTSITCTLTSQLSGSVVSSASMVTTVNPCLPGWDLTTERVCRRCLTGSYSPEGKLCKPCPESGECEDALGDEANEVSSTAGWNR